MFNKISPAIKVALFYLIFSLVWIFTSDEIVASIAHDKESLHTLQTFKGWLFVTATSCLIYFLTNHYIKQQSRLNTQIEAKRQELRNIIMFSPIPTVVFNEDGEFLIMNKIWLELTGYEYEDIDNLNKWFKKAYNKEAPETQKFIQDIFTITSRIDNGEVTVHTKDKRKIVWHFNSAPFGIRNGKKVIIASAIDITQLKKQNAMIMQQSKMAALGEMIENIAHQWRQPLSSIAALSTGIQLKNEMNELQSEELNTSMKSIHDNTQYLSNTIDDFKNFFDKEKSKRYIKIDHTIQKAIDLLKPRVYNHNIEIVTQMEHLELESYENELIQVFINLINNSIDELKKTTIERLILIKAVQVDTTLVINVHDSAGGIPEHILPKIFEPYFTSKDKSHGTGIGLFMSDEIISKHCNGTIEALNDSFMYRTKEYYGANFKITLPL